MVGIVFKSLLFPKSYKPKLGTRDFTEMATNMASAPSVSCKVESNCKVWATKFWTVLLNRCQQYKAAAGDVRGNFATHTFED